MSTIRIQKSEQVRMAPAQFAALAELMRLRPGPAQESVRLHLVDGLSVPDAARESGCPYRHAWQAVQRALAAIELVRIAAP